jgi:hypothetical protein
MTIGQLVNTFKRGTEWPHEGFVQAALEAYFSSLGFAIEHHKTIDLVCSHPITGEKWSIEAKGKTTAIGLDFRTGLGQLLQGMKQRSHNYGIAVPDIPEFRRQIQAVPSWVAAALAIHWLLVQSDGSVTVETTS